MIRAFNQYMPSRTILLVGGEVAIIAASFALAVLIRFGRDSALLLNNPHAVWTIGGIALAALLCSHYMELYDLRWMSNPEDLYSRVLILVGTLSIILAVLIDFFPELSFGRSVLVTGLCILAIAWILWRWVYRWIIFLPALRERVYLLGNGERANRIREALRKHRELGMDVIGWVGETPSGASLADQMSKLLDELGTRRAVDRVIVALADRRSVMPVRELLDLRLNGVRIEDSTSLLERISGQIEVDELHPSWMIFGQGFRFAPRHRLLRGVVSRLLALTLLIVMLPLLPLIALLIKISSPGPVLYRQRRVGLGGKAFNCYKFRTMRPDAEADTGPTWASDDDPRITAVGAFLRRTRLDEIPQLFNVLCGDMGFVGPRPERPEFVEKLSQQIPYYQLRHVAPPGITGWAQINYGYGSSVEEAKEKLRYDLYYIRNVSVVLDLLIVFYTLRAVIIGRGVR